jgi:putative spermidine/putrescine transport system permease protein
MAKKPAVLLALPAAFLLVMAFIIPTVIVLCQAFSADGLAGFAKFFGSSFYMGILWKTVWMGVKVTFVALLLGFPTGYFIARSHSRYKNLMLICAVFPFLVSAVVRAYGWMVLLGDNGVINQILLGTGISSKPLKLLYNKTGVLIGLVHLLLPHMILSTAAVVQGIDRNIEYASQTLGANRFQTFFKVTLPLSIPGIITGCILVFISSMTAYVTPKLLGGSRYPLMSTLVQIEAQVNFNWAMAAAVSFILMFAILLFLLAINLSTSRLMNRLGGGQRE